MTGASLAAVRAFESRVRWGRLRTAALAAALAAICLAAHGARVGPTAAARAEKLYVPSGRLLREASIGFREPAADWLWFQAIQYYGEYRHGQHDLAYFRGMVACVTRLDPRFLEAYRFGALVLATEMEDVPGAVDLLRQGILANPRGWLLPFEVGFLHYTFGRDPRRATVWFDVAARQPDATDFARRFAAFAHKRAGQLEVSLVLWKRLRETTASQEMRDLADRMIASCEQQIRVRDAGAGRTP